MPSSARRFPIPNDLDARSGTPRTDELRALGAGDEVLTRLASLSGDPGRVVRVDRGRALVATVDSDRVVALDPRLPSLAVGDWVTVDPRGSVLHRLERTSVLVRNAASKRTEPQVLAVNVDVVLVVAAAPIPPERLPAARIERLIALAWSSGATPVLVLTKLDLLPHVGEPRKERSAAGQLLREPARPPALVHSLAAATSALAPGCAVHLVSTVTGEGIDAVAAHARPGRTLAVIGASGVGKSSLVNALAGAPVLDVGAVRQVDGKGRHVTVRRELVPLPTGAVVLDTPGLRGVALWASGDVEAVDGLSAAFSDIEALAADCRFRDCGHRGEPGCAVAAAADAGLLDADRIARHDKLRRELAYLERKQDVRAALEEKRRWKQIHRDNRARGGRP